MNNDKSRPKKERGKGRRFHEKAVFIHYYVRRWVYLNQLWNTLVICRMGAITTFRNLRYFSYSWLANQKSSEMERIR